MKYILMAAATAVVCSAVTAVTVNALTSDNIQAIASEQAPERGSFFTVANSVTPANDFTKAAESTINGVVSIKSFSTPRGYGQGGGQGFFGDPFLEYFFGQPQQ
ncbi:MAG: hypothetical protein K2H83_03950, partial [Duncaniella sp.]|nr:hypothetical protein [Duncaniella sp.]